MLRQTSDINQGPARGLRVQEVCRHKELQRDLGGDNKLGDVLCGPTERAERGGWVKMVTEKEGGLA